MKTLKLDPVDLGLLRDGPGGQLRFEVQTRQTFDEYGFGFLRGIPQELHDATLAIKQGALPCFQDQEWARILQTWPRTKHGQLGPTTEGEEVHLDPVTRQPRDSKEKKRYVSVDAQGNGWGQDDDVRKAIPVVVSRRYSIAMQMARAYENAKALKPGSISALLTIEGDSHTTARIQWYPPDGYSQDHADKCAITVLDFEPGLEIEYPQGSGEYYVLEGAEPGDLVINIGDTVSYLLGGEGATSTRHRVRVPATCSVDGRIVMPLFVHTNRRACFSDGKNIWQWCVDEWTKEGAAQDRLVQ